MTEQRLTLKWGTLKGWNVEGNDAAYAALNQYRDGGYAMSAAQQHDTPEQKQALCDLIDAIHGPITNDWSGEQMSKDEAKAYVLEYRK